MFFLRSPNSFAPALIAAGILGLALTPALAQKPKPIEEVKKPVDVQGVVKTISQDGKTLAVVIAAKKKNEAEKTAEVKLDDKTAVSFDNVAAGAAKISKDYVARVTLVKDSKGTAATAVFGRGGK